VQTNLDEKKTTASVFVTGSHHSNVRSPVDRQYSGGGRYLGALKSHSVWGTKVLYKDETEVWGFCT